MLMIFGTFPFQRLHNSGSMRYTPQKTNMTMETSTMNEDVFPIENGDFPMSC